MLTLMELSPEAIECMRRATERGANSTLSEMWAVWRTLQDKVTAHREYRWNGERVAKKLLLNLAQFNMDQMAIFNGRQWKTDNVFRCPCENGRTEDCLEHGQNTGECIPEMGYTCPAHRKDESGSF